MRIFEIPSRSIVAAGVALVASAAMMACGSKGASSGSGAKQDFIDHVYPSIAPTCSKCHATGDRGAPIFLASNSDGSYGALEGTPGLIAPANASPMVQHGLHTGPALTPDQEKLVSDWLAMEVKERGIIDNVGKPANLRAAFDQFGACMDYTRWSTQYGLDKLAEVQTDNSGQCMSCHNQGQASNWLSADPVETFNHFTEFPFVQRLVVGQVDAKGAFSGLVPSQRLINKGNETQQQNANSHPRYSLPSVPINMTDSINRFVNDTLSDMNSGNCTKALHPGDAGID